MPCTEICGCHLSVNIGCKNLPELHKIEVSESEDDSDEYESDNE